MDTLKIINPDKIKNNIKTQRVKLSKCMRECESIILSIVVISNGIVNLPTDFNEMINIEPKENIVILNISHTDSYSQDLELRFNSLYSQLNTKYIFPLQIWKNNIEKTKLSTGNINRYIYNKLNQTKQTEYIEENMFNEIEKLKVNIMIDGLKQNIPKYNYILSPQVIKLFSSMCEQMNLEQIYFSEWTNVLKQNNYLRLTKFIENKYKISNPILVRDVNLGMTKEQIQYFRQCGINYDNTNNHTRKRKYNIYDKQQNIRNLKKKNIQETFNNDINTSNNVSTSNSIIELDCFDLSFELK